MVARNFNQSRLTMVTVGFMVGTGIVVGVALATSGDPVRPTTTEPGPEIAMPAPRLSFDDLEPELPSITAAAVPGRATTVATVRTIRINGAMTLDVQFSPLDEDRQSTYSLTGTFFGDMTGEWVEEGTEQYGEVDAAGHVRSVGSGRATAELTVPGVGTGRVESTNEWQSDNQGSVLGVSTITSGSGELEGATGTMRWNSTDDAGTIAYQLELTVPGP